MFQAICRELSGMAERYAILERTGCAEVAGTLGVGTGDLVMVPPGASQRIRNVGTGDLVFLAVCTPRFTRDVNSRVSQSNVTR